MKNEVLIRWTVSEAKAQKVVDMIAESMGYSGSSINIDNLISIKTLNSDLKIININKLIPFNNTNTTTKNYQDVSKVHRYGDKVVGGVEGGLKGTTKQLCARFEAACDTVGVPCEWPKNARVRLQTKQHLRSISEKLIARGGEDPVGVLIAGITRNDWLMKEAKRKWAFIDKNFERVFWSGERKVAEVERPKLMKTYRELEKELGEAIDGRDKEWSKRVAAKMERISSRLSDWKASEETIARKRGGGSRSGSGNSPYGSSWVR